MKKLIELLSEFAKELKTFEPRTKAVVPDYFIKQLVAEVSDSGNVVFEPEEVQTLSVNGISFITRQAVARMIAEKHVEIDAEQCPTVDQFIKEDKLIVGEDSLYAFLIRKSLNLPAIPVLESQEVASTFHKRNLRRFEINYKRKESTKGRTGSVFMVGMSLNEVEEKFHFFTERRNRIIATIEAGYIGIENETFEVEKPFKVKYYDKLKKLKVFKTIAKSALDAISGFYLEIGLMNVDDCYTEESTYS